MQWTLIVFGLVTVAIAMWSWNLDPEPASLDPADRPEPVPPQTQP